MEAHSDGRRERGDIAIIAAIVLPLIILAAAFAIDLGHIAYVKRHLQKVADVAAIAAAQDLSNPQAGAQASAQYNGFNPDSAGHQMQVTPGYWNPQSPYVQGPTYFTSSIPYGQQVNAAKVQVTENVPFFFVFGQREVSAQAIAWSSNMAGFSISSQLLDLNTQQSALLNSILGGLLGTSVNLGVAGYNALLGTSVSLGQLAQALQVGTVNNLLQANLTLPGLYQGILTAVGNQQNGGVLSSQATGALQQLVGLNVPGSYQVPVGQILQLGLADPNAAVNAQVNVLNLITAAAMVANQHHFVDIPNIGVQLGGLANISLGLYVISPPSIAFGQPGQNPDGTWKTQAHAAQVAVALHIQLLQGIPALGGGLLNIPIYLEVDPAQGHLTSLQCAVPQSGDQVQIGANTGILTAIIGDIPQDALSNTTQPLSASAQPATLLNVLNLIKVTMNPLVIPLSDEAGYGAGNYAYTPLNFSGQPQQSQTIDTNAVGGALGNVLTTLAQQLQQPNSLNVSLLGLNLGLGNVVGALVGALNPILVPLVNSLNGLLVPVLQLLGVQLGSAQVTYNAVSCGNATLVY
jgi:uncharacterized membrane protein